MTGRDKLIGILKGERARAFPVVLPYIGIFLRDHWDEVTRVPWWAVADGNLDASLQVQRDLYDALGIDWVSVGPSQPRSWRERHRVREDGGNAFLVNEETGEETQLHRPQPGGGHGSWQCRVHSPEDIDRLAPIPDLEQASADGRFDIASAMVEEYGRERFTLGSMGAPFWGTFGYFGFERLMLNLVEEPELVERLLERLTSAAVVRLKAQAAAGIDGIWIEDCYSSADLISLDHFRRFAAPYVRQLIDTCREEGLFSIYYFCGDVSDRLPDLVEMQPDALSFEESKKGFVLDLSQIDDVLQDRTCLLGNLDSINVLQRGRRDELTAAIDYQASVGRRNGRFAFSLGSPVTPPTSTGRLQEFIALARERADAAG